MIKRVDKRLQAVQCLTGNKIKIIAALIILLYNGKRGNLSIKYFFYWFYPVHISLLYGASLLFK